MPNDPSQDRIRAALVPLCVEHLQELRDFGVPMEVRRVLGLSMWVVGGDPAATWKDALTVWSTPANSFAAGLHTFIALLRRYQPSGAGEWEEALVDFLLSDEAEELTPERYPVGAVLVDFLTAVLDAGPQGHSGGDDPAATRRE